MTFQPVVPAGGVAGWRFLQRTYDTQLQTFSASPVNDREIKYFLDNISNVKSAEELVSDRRLLQVALGAFGLEDDINNRYFVQKILSDGTRSDDAWRTGCLTSGTANLLMPLGWAPGTFARLV